MVEVFEAIYHHKLSAAKIGMKPGFCSCVVMASGGYPKKYETGKVIFGLDEKGQAQNAFVYHAGTKYEDDKFRTAGGRVLGVTCTALTLQAALDKSYDAVSQITFDGAHYRNDIGKRALEALRDNPLSLDYKDDMEDYLEENGVYLRQ